MTQSEINKAIEISINSYGRDATIKALNEMFHNGLITSKKVFNALDIINK